MTTPIGQVEPHIRALMQMLEDRLGFSVGLGIAETRPPALAVYPDAGSVQAARLAGDRSAVEIYFITHAIGTGPEQALWVNDQARTALLGEPPVVAGRKTYRMQQVAAPQMERDDLVQPPLYVQAAEYWWMSQPSSA